jgi:hypothetical protein
VSAPAVVITLPLEGQPRLDLVCGNASERARLAQWISDDQARASLVVHAAAVVGLWNPAWGYGDDDDGQPS